MAKERLYPSEDSLGKPCEYWSTELQTCYYPKIIMFGRVSCRGIVDEPCLYLKDKRPITNPDCLSEEVKHELEMRERQMVDTSWQPEPNTSAEDTL